MTFTYDLANVDATKVLISKVRLEIGDTVSGAGVRPDSSNLTDEEISLWLSEESDSVMLAAARACDALARMWSTMTNERVGPRSIEFGRVAANFEKQAIALRSQNSSSVAYFF